MTTTLDLNGTDVTKVRLLTPRYGAWLADVELELEDPTMPAPSGPAVLRIDTQFLTGMIDPRATGKVGAKARVRLVAGFGGWDQPVAHLHLNNPAGVQLAAVLAVTAAEVGETLGLSVPEVLGTDYHRIAGPAARAFGARPWWVDFFGVTHATPRVPTPATPDVEVLNWYPDEQRAEIACDGILQPGTILVDTRFGQVEVADVEQTFSAAGARANAWCSKNDAPRLLNALRKMVLELAGVAHLKAHRYRVYGPGEDGKVPLQAVAVGEDADLLPATVWFGVPGVTADLKPGSEVIVEHIDGEMPIVRAFDPDGVPVKLMVDSIAELTLGATSAIVNVGSQLVKLAGGSVPVARMGDPIQAGPFSGAIMAGNPKVLA